MIDLASSKTFIVIPNPWDEGQVLSVGKPFYLPGATGTTLNAGNFLRMWLPNLQVAVLNQGIVRFSTDHSSVTSYHVGAIIGFPAELNDLAQWVDIPSISSVHNLDDIYATLEQKRILGPKSDPSSWSFP